MRPSIQLGVIAAAVLLAAVSGSWVSTTVRAQAPAAPAAPAPSATQAPPPGNATAGQKLYLKVGCQRCHGYVGQGAAPTGPRIAPTPMVFTAFSRYIREPRAQMPPYTAKVLSDQDLADIHAFLRAQSGPAKVDGLLPPP